MTSSKKTLETGDIAVWAKIVRRNLNHHGKGVRAMVPTILGNVLLYHDEGTLEVSSGKKYSSFGTAKFGGRQITFSYSHKKGAIDAREDNTRGRTIVSFNDRSGEMEILRFFTELSGGRRPKK